MSMVKKNYNYLISTGLLISVFAGLVLASSSSATSASTATATVKVAASCTLTTLGGGNYSATVPNGTSAEISGSTLSVSCNDAGGFALYAVGYSDDTIGNNNMIGGSTNIPTNTSGTNSYWAMKINPTSGTTPTIENSFNNYHIVPDIHTKIASYASSTGTGSLSVNATYKANISSTQLAGNYLGKVKYTLIHPSNGNTPVEPLAEDDCPARNFCYAPNANDIEGTMLATDFQSIATSPIAGRQTGISTNYTELLSAYNYSRRGYGFAGWSPEFDAQVNSDDFIYGPQAEIITKTDGTGDADVSSHGLILYPVWVKSAGSMQSFSYNDCNSMEINDVTALTDDRDGETYAIARLADGRCWMIENLRLDNYANITPANTNSVYNSFGGVFTGLAKSENENFGYSTTSNSIYSIDGSTANVISDGDSYARGYRIPRYNNDNTNRDLPVSPNQNGNSGRYQWYGYGNYYNWPAAIADTSYHDTNNESYTEYSLCPKNWFLPQGGNKENESINDYWALIVDGLYDGTKPSGYDNDTMPHYDSNSETKPIVRAIRSYPNNFIYSGYISGNSFQSRGQQGEYWSSTASDRDLAYRLTFSWAFLSPGTSNGGYKGRGKTIRCLFKSR